MWLEQSTISGSLTPMFPHRLFHCRALTSLRQCLLWNRDLESMSSTFLSKTCVFNHVHTTCGRVFKLYSHFSPSAQDLDFMSPSFLMYVTGLNGLEVLNEALRNLLAQFSTQGHELGLTPFVIIDVRLSHFSYKVCKLSCRNLSLPFHTGWARSIVWAGLLASLFCFSRSHPPS